MAQITSQEELEEWLKDKPANFAQVVAARAALLVLPFALTEETQQEWVDESALNVIRALSIAWATSNFSAHNMASSASYAANAANRAAVRAFNSAYALARSAYAAARAPDGAHAAAYAVYMASDAAAYVASDAAIWNNTSADCNWLITENDKSSAAHSLTYQPLWQVDEPKRWADDWDYATTRLLTLNPTYQVWIDWYNRRIEGHDAAFDIPCDTDRVHDKTILARLADATDEDFWGKGATHVNTTLQRWIDEAREQAAIDYVASGAPLNLGSAAELAARGEMLAHFGEMEAELAKAQDQLASLADTGHSRMGHNQPDNVPSLLQEEMGLLTQRVTELETTVAVMAAAFAKLNRAVPIATAAVTEAAQVQGVEAVTELVTLAPELSLVGQALKFLEDKTSPEVRKGFENAVGATLFAAVFGAPYYIYVTLSKAIAAFLHYFFTVWFPILPG